MAVANIQQGWVDQPNGRGTWDILWSCLLTIFICCWTIVQPNIGTPGLSRWYQFFDKTLCLVIAAIAPEILVYLSFWEYMRARSTTTYMSSRPWMGQNWSITHSFFTQMGGISVSMPSAADEPPQNGWVSDETLCKLVRKGQLEATAIPTKAEILDKGKADSLVKAIALIQSLWLLVQVVARAAQHLPITTLEIATVAFLPCAILISFFWWQKPMDISEPINLRITSSLAMKNLGNSVVQDDPTERIETHNYTRYPLLRDAKETVSTALLRINLWGLTSAIFCIIFGGLHCIAWDFHFPTPIERLLWRICSILIAVALPLSWALTHTIAFALERFAPNLWRSMSKTKHFQHGISDNSVIAGPFFSYMHGAGLVMYSLARLYLIAEMFSSLRSQPAGAYDTVNWTEFWPHS